MTIKIVKVMKSGNSIYVPLPPSVIKLEKGEQVLVTNTDDPNTIMIKKLSTLEV